MEPSPTARVATYQSSVRSPNDGSTADPMASNKPVVADPHLADADQYGHSHHQSQSHCNNDQYDSRHDCTTTALTTATITTTIIVATITMLRQINVTNIVIDSPPFCTLLMSLNENTSKTDDFINI
uniref:Uncharacterized protein n=1 Tax=Romanomermis culicivorax TaxID=13658 RepID=A0A915J983_ROMCU